MSAQDDIRNLLYRYCEMIDTGDVDGLVDLFADAVVSGFGATREWRGRDEMSFAVLGDDLASRVNECLRIVNAVTVAIRYASDDRDRKFFCDLLQLRHGAFGPGLGAFLDDRHRIAGVRHLGKNHQISA